MNREFSTKRWMCECAYDGSTFNGWQKQPNGQAVQDKIEQTLKVFTKSEPLVRAEPMQGSCPGAGFSL